MRGVDPSSNWTHLILGMAVAGAGSGLVNTPLASTAVGVVKPEHAGMASGINATFRQIGIAVAVAVLGSIFDSGVSTTTGSAAGRYASGLNDVLLVAGSIALVAGALAFVLIRRKDFYLLGTAAGAESRAESGAEATARQEGSAAR
jgi:hypothetical protein